MVVDCWLLSHDDDDDDDAAATVGQEDVVCVLVQLPAAAAAVSSNDASSRLAAVRQRRLQSPLTAVHWAANGGYRQCVRVLLGCETWRPAADRPTAERRTVGDVIAPAGCTPLMLAARAGSADVIREIIDVVGDVLVADRQDDDGL